MMELEATGGAKAEEQESEGKIMALDKSMSMFTPKCRTVREEAGFRLTFFCELCGSGYTTPLLGCGTLKEALSMGERDARLHFNRCRSCHRWVCDEHFNENRMMCTACMPRICARCGSPAAKNEQYCALCGAPQFERYIERTDDDE